MLTLFPKQWEHWGDLGTSAIPLVRKKSLFMVRTTIQTILAQNLVNFGCKALVNRGKVNTGILRSLRHVSQKEKFSFNANVDQDIPAARDFRVFWQSPRSCKL
jgi:hypothetical protein